MLNQVCFEDFVPPPRATIRSSAEVRNQLADELDAFNQKDIICSFESSLYKVKVQITLLDFLLIITVITLMKRHY